MDSITAILRALSGDQAQLPYAPATPQPRPATELERQLELLGVTGAVRDQPFGPPPPPPPAPTPANRVGEAAAAAGRTMSFAPFALGPILEGLGGMLQGPSLLEQQRQWDAEHPGLTGDVGPVAGQVAFMGAPYGVRPARLRNLWHGTTAGPEAAANIIQGGFRHGQSAELEIPGTSVSYDPTMSWTNFGGSNPDQLLRVRTSVQPEQVRNLRPSEYAASALPEIRGEAPAVSKPQSYYNEREIFFPSTEGGQSSLTAEFAAPQDRVRIADAIVRQRNGIYRAQQISNAADTLNNFRTSTESAIPDEILRERIVAEPPTPANMLDTAQELARGATPYDNPMFPGRVLNLLGHLRDPTTDLARVFNATFPESTRAYREVLDQANLLNGAYRNQRRLGEATANAVEARRGQEAPPQETMAQQDQLYRAFTRENNNFMSALRDGSVAPAERLQQQLFVQRLFDGLQQGGFTLRHAAQAAQTMRSIGFPPDQIRDLLSTPNLLHDAVLFPTSLHETYSLWNQR